MRNLFKSSLAHVDSAGLERLRQTAVLLLNNTLCIVHANAHAETLLETPMSRLQGMPVSQIFHEPRAVESLLSRVRPADGGRPDRLTPTYLLRKALCRDERRLWQVQVHQLSDAQLGEHLLLQVTERRLSARLRSANRRAKD